METYPLGVNTREQGLHAYHSPNEILCIITGRAGPQGSGRGYLAHRQQGAQLDCQAHSQRRFKNVQ